MNSVFVNVIEVAVKMRNKQFLYYGKVRKEYC